MPLFWLGLISLALGVAPDREIKTHDLGQGKLKRLEQSDDGNLVAMVDRGADALILLNTDDWTVETVDECLVQDVMITGANTADSDYVDGDLWVHMLCGTGKVRGFTWNDGERLTWVNDDDTVFTWDTGVDVAWGIWEDPVTYELYVVGETDGTLEIHNIDVSTNDVDYGGLPSPFSFNTYTEAVLNESTGMLLVAHEEDRWSNYTFGAAATTLASAIMANFEMNDIHLSLVNTAYAVDKDHGKLVEYQPASFTYTLMRDDLISPSAVAVSGTSGEEYLIILGRDAEIFDINSGLADVSAPVATLDLSITARDAIVGYDDYVYAGGDDGKLAMLSVRPWVGPVTVTPDTLDGEGDVVFKFQSDEAGTYTVKVGGDRYGTGGSTVATGSVAADTAVEVTIPVDDSFAEGANKVYVLVEDGDGYVGHGRADITVDTPPGAVELSASDLGFSDSALTVNFDGIQDADLDHYDVFVTVTVFSEDDWSSGGPTFDGTDALTTPIEVQAAGGESVSVKIDPLTNGETYYIAVRATDTNGTEGPMSNVISGKPRPAFTAAELSGDEGGFACSAGAGAGTTLGWGIMVGLLAMARRRVAAVAAMAIVASLLAPKASAQEVKDDRFAPDLTPAWANFEVRYGWVNLVDPDLDTVYGTTSNNILQLEVGAQLYRYVEIDLGFGLLQELAFQIDSAGSRSSQKTMMTWFPLALDVSGRLHVFDEQILVPYVRVGGDLIFWQELADASGGGKSKVGGTKLGWHFGVGGNFLLDFIAPTRASQLEAATGINDTYLTFEWRRQFVAPEYGGFSFKGDQDSGHAGFDFSGDVFTIGLKLDL